MSVSLLGEKVAFPICVAPTAMQRMAHDEGEVATARGRYVHTTVQQLVTETTHIHSLCQAACAKLGTCMVLSSWSTTSMEEVAEANGGGLRWYQLYVYEDRELTGRLVHRVERAGYKAIVLTVDTPVVGKRLADARNKFNLPSHLSLANFTRSQAQSSLVTKNPHYTMSPRLTWDTVDWLCVVTKLPVILKGILTAEDAREAVRHQVQGILVSNHGGRQLDGVPATVSSLPFLIVE